MSQQPVPIFRAAHLLPYLKFFNEKGVHTEAALNKFRLPTCLEDQPEARLPLVPTLRLLSYLERTQGVRDVGVLINKHINLKLLSSANQQSISSAHTLKTALEAFLRGIGSESSVVEGWVHSEGGETKLYKSHRISLDDEELRVMKVHFMLLYMALIRTFAGPGWYPRAIGLQCVVPLSAHIGKYFPGTQFFFGQSNSWLSMPHEMLGLQKVQHLPSRPTSPLLSEAAPYAAQMESLATSLKRILKTYLVEGYPSIELAADISGMSVRTLQRNLAQANTTYSKLVEDARFEAALEMLNKPNTKIIDVAYAVGYEDPSHFSRAFRRLAGTTPRKYRMSGAA